METISASKLKNIVILILVVVDIFLAVLVIPRAIAANTAERAASRQIEELLAANEITVLPGVIPGHGAATRDAVLERNTEAQLRVAEYLLGTGLTQSDLGGGIISYENSRGTVTFRAGGEMTAQLSEPPAGNLSHPEDALRLLEKIGVSVEKLSRETADGHVVVTASQSIRGVEVRGSDITLTYGMDGLQQVSGRLYLDGSPDYVATERLTAATAMLAFVNSRDELGYVCAEITEMRVIYLPVSGSDNRLSPAWLITTDTGSFRVDFASCQVVQE